jgi:hypothetical protein
LCLIFARAGGVSGSTDERRCRAPGTAPYGFGTRAGGHSALDRTEGARPMRSDGSTAQVTAHRLVHCVLDSDSDGLTDALETVVDQQEDGLKPYVRGVVAELIQVGAKAVRESVGPDEQPAFAVDLRDGTNDTVGIDELEPQVRATIRALLADLNGCPEDAQIQLDLAVRQLDPLTGLETVRRALTMTIALLQWSGEPR